MRKRIAGLIVASLCLPALAFHNFSMTPDTVGIGDSVTISGDYEAIGDTADIFMFIDRNNNGVFDSTIDLNPMEDNGMAVIDGDTLSTESIDSLRDGKFYAKFAATSFPFNMPGKLVMIFTDKAIADTASVFIIEKPTKTFVMGKVTGPSGGLADLIISASFQSQKGSANMTYSECMTKADGSYVLYLDTGSRGSKAYIRVRDDLNVLPDSLYVPSGIDTMLVDSLKEINFSCKVVHAYAKGLVVDEKGIPVGGVELRLNDQNEGDGIAMVTDSFGVFVTGIYPGYWNVNLDNKNTTGFLIKSRTGSFMVSDTTDTAYVKVSLYRATSSIRGKIVDPDTIFDPIQGSFRLSINAFTRTTSDTNTYFASSLINQDKSFSIPSAVSQDSGYSISCGTWGNFPSNYYIFPPNPVSDMRLKQSPIGKYLAGYENVRAGADSINFYLRKGDATIRVALIDTVGDIKGATVFFVDTANHFYMIQSDNNNKGMISQALPAGNYVVVAMGWSQTGQQQAMFGPIALVDQDTTIELTLSPAMMSSHKVINAKGHGFALGVTTRGGLRFTVATPISGHAVLRIYSMSGRLVQTMLDKDIGVGSKMIPGSGLQLKAGNMYVAKLTLSGPLDYQKTQMFTLVP